MNYGSMSAPVIGVIMRDIVTRILTFVRSKRFQFEASVKGKKLDGDDDWVTNIDREAQKLGVRLLKEYFPLFGIVAEEADCRVPSTHPEMDIWFTLDPIDGTRAFMRRQSHGVGTMLSLVCDSQVIAVCIGDILTGELYYYRPESNKTHRLCKDSESQLLVINLEQPLASQYLLLRHAPHKSPASIKQLAESNLFRDYEITGGSIGISMARLWKGEVGGAVLSAGKVTPWDMCPIIGMCERLGFQFWELDSHGVFPHQLIQPAPTSKVYIQANEWLVIHRSRTKEFLDYCRLNQQL